MEVQRHSSPEVTSEMARRAPHPALAPYVVGYTGYHERTAAPLVRRELPGRTVTVILNLGPAIDVDLGAGGGAYHSFVSGLHDGPALVAHRGEQRGVQVDLTPLGARRLLGVPQDEVARAVVDLDALLGRDGPRLLERLAGAPGWAARFALLDDALARRCDAAPEPPADVAWAWRALAASRGTLSVTALAEELRCSRRHLHARFREHIGLAPKRVARILRFEHALELLQADARAGLAAVAARAGYYDQAHLARDFRELAGLAPGALLGRRLPDERGFGGFGG